MGWISYMATHYKNGKVDVKAEMDAMYTQEEHDGVNPSTKETVHYPKWEVLKSRMVGRVYYAAAKITDSQKETEEVFAVVSLTSTKTDDGFNFGYKSMTEDMGPGYYDCPESILNLLSPTDDEYALEWREKCRERIKKKKEGRTKNALPVGSIIRYQRLDGSEIELEKMSPSYQFKSNWWYCRKDNTYMPNKYIPESFEIVRIGKE